MDPGIHIYIYIFIYECSKCIYLHIFTYIWVTYLWAKGSYIFQHHGADGTVGCERMSDVSSSLFGHRRKVSYDVCVCTEYETEFQTISENF